MTRRLAAAGLVCGLITSTLLPFLPSGTARPTPPTRWVAGKVTPRQTSGAAGESKSDTHGRLTNPRSTVVSPAAHHTTVTRTASRASRHLQRPPLAEETRWRSTSARPFARSTAPTPHRRKRRIASTGGSRTLTDLDRALMLPEPWRSIVRCESLGDASWRSSSSSNARGFFQFLRSTWRSLGLHGDPAAASFDEQYSAARRLARRDGLRAWSCARLLGLA